MGSSSLLAILSPIINEVKSKITEVAQPVSQEVKDAPKRAKNDPRYKSE